MKNFGSQYILLTNRHRKGQKPFALCVLEEDGGHLLPTLLHFYYLYGLVKLAGQFTDKQQLN